MRVLALVSGGKDSCYNMMQCVGCGHTIVALANLHPVCSDVEELDSYMYQTVGHRLLKLYASAMDLPLYRGEICGSAVSKDRQYTPTDNDEVEDLYELLVRVKNELDFDAVSVGAILSDYQRNRVENVCRRLNIISLCYLWQRNQAELLQEMITCRVEAIIVKVACLGLSPHKHLGKSISEMQPHLLQLADQFAMNVCGEGGEYETFTLDCPLFLRRIVIDEQKIVVLSADQIAPVGHLHLLDGHLQDKIVPANTGDHLQRSLLVGLPMPSLLPESALVATSCSLVPSAEAVESSESMPVIRVVVSNCWLYFSRVVGVQSSSDAGMTSALHRLSAALQLHNAQLCDVVRLDMYVADMSQYTVLNAEYTAAFDGDGRPVRLCVQTCLPRGWTVLISGAVWRPRSNDRRMLHVRSWSHWAPASIGPYSQACRCGRLVLVAGQIGLEPGSQRLVADGSHQARLALRHTTRLLLAMDAPARSVQLCVCYLTDLSLQDTCVRLMRAIYDGALLCLLLVPALPRGASVEWHVVAHVDEIGGDRRSSSVTIADVDVAVETCCWPHQRGAAILVTCRFSRDSAVSVSQLEACIRASCCHMLRMHRDKNNENRDISAGSCAVSLTVFYQRDFFQFDVQSVFGGESLPDCVLNYVAVLQVHDGGSQCVIVGLSSSGELLKQD